MELERVKFVVGQVVYAKIKGYPPWPAYITHFPRAKIARVRYFNSEQWNELSIDKLTSFHAGKSIATRYCGRNPAFTAAYRTMQLTMENKEKQPEAKPAPNIKIKILSKKKLKEMKNEKQKIINDEQKQIPHRLRSGRLY